MEKNEKILAYSSLYFGMNYSEVKIALRNDKKIVRPAYLNKADGGIHNLPPDQDVMYRATFFDNNYLLDFHYTHDDELCRLVFKNESFITADNFNEGVVEFDKLIMLIEAKYGTADLQEIGQNIGDYFIAKWEREKEIIVGMNQHPMSDKHFQIMMVFSYIPLLVLEEQYEKSQDSIFIENVIDDF
ncbi:hypothetical protein [uncultured Sphaerochaeta sp.]|uniref:hypothetical protein n=1 Tax=uncultured Sphaerochaeta sp. TaxID=886478 RepID=UPI0029CA37B7|nr:hypothetical protein [uncultured Sphaerochaeta sp.]